LTSKRSIRDPINLGDHVTQEEIEDHCAYHDGVRLAHYRVKEEGQHELMMACVKPDENRVNLCFFCKEAKDEKYVKKAETMLSLLEVNAFMAWLENAHRKIMSKLLG